MEAPPLLGPSAGQIVDILGVAKIRDRKGTPKNLCDRDFAELSGELPGAICLKTLVLLGSALELFRKFFGTVRVLFLGDFLGSFLALDKPYILRGTPRTYAIKTGGCDRQ